MPRKLVPSERSATRSTKTFAIWRTRSHARSERSRSGRNALRRRSVKRRELQGRRNGRRNAKNERKNARRSALKGTANEIVCAARETRVGHGREVEFGIGQEIDEIDQETESETGTATATEIEIVMEIGDGEAIGTTVAIVVALRKSRSNSPRKIMLVWKKRLSQIF